MKSSEALRKARVLIETRAARYLCCALDVVDDSTTNVAENLELMFKDNLPLESWMICNQPGFLEFYRTLENPNEWMRQYRLDWIDWLIPQYEAVGD